METRDYFFAALATLIIAALWTGVAWATHGYFRAASGSIAVFVGVGVGWTVIRNEDESFFSWKICIPLLGLAFLAGHELARPFEKPTAIDQYNQSQAEGVAMAVDMLGTAFGVNNDPLVQAWIQKAEEFFALSTEYEWPQFMIKHQYTSASSAGQVTEAEIENFRATIVPQLEYYYMRAHPEEALKYEAPKTSFIAAVFFAFIDLISACIGMLIAYKALVY
ncbi:hypothetical protein JXA32_02080 [Candidatus Sumerlaeota bacterium]|nr:hypothetical protein [Candidatus Sumerlaeota bacterium]